MPRRNRVDPFGDLFAVPGRGLFAGNRGCLVDGTGHLVRHHVGSLWITCTTRYQDWRHPLDAPKTWTPLFFLDDAVALSAGHRPCGLCRRTDYVSYREALSSADPGARRLRAGDINRRLQQERLRPGRGLVRAQNRILWSSALDALPAGTVIIEPKTGAPHLTTRHHLQPFTFDGWGPPIVRPRNIATRVLTPPTSVTALERGFTPLLHPTAQVP